MNKKAYSETSIVQRISALLCLYWWNLTWSHHLATSRPKWVNTIRIAFLMSSCSSFNVSASKVEPIMEQLTNHSWIGTKTVQFPIKHTWCIQLHAVNLNTYSFVCSVVLQRKSSRRTLHRHATEVWLKNCKKRTLSSFSWKTTIRPLVYNAWNSNSTARLTKYSNQWVLTCQLGTQKKWFPHVWQLWLHIML